MTVRLHHDVSGRSGRPTVIFGGSIGSTVAAWESQRAALSEDFHVIAYDHRGHGGSPAPAGPYSIDDLAQDVLTLLDDHDVKRAHFVGLSLGGMVALQIAAREPHRVDRLAVLCTATHHSDPAAWTERACTVRSGGTEAVADTSLERWLTAGFRQDHPRETAWVRAMIVAVDREGYAGCCEAIADMDLRADVSRIQAPTLVLAGAHDPAVSTEQLRETAAAITGARFAIIPGAHVPPLEHPDIVTGLLLEHLAANP